MSTPENEDLKKEFVAYANKILANQTIGNTYSEKTLTELTNFSEMTNAERRKTAYALKIAQTKQANQAAVATDEQKINEASKKATAHQVRLAYNKYSGDDVFRDMHQDEFARQIYINTHGQKQPTDEEFEEWVRDPRNRTTIFTNGTLINQADADIQARYEDMSLYDKLDYLEQGRENLIEGGKANEAHRLDKIIDYLKSAVDAVEGIRSKLNVQFVQEAIMEMSWGKNEDGTNKTLLDMSPSALKSLGLDRIILGLAEYLQNETGGMADGSSYFYVDKNGDKIVTEDAKKEILKGLKMDETLYSIVTGQTMTLVEALNMPDGEQKVTVLKNFASALGITVDDLEAAVDSFGNFSLSQVSSDAASLSESFSNIQKIIVDIGSGTLTWADTMQTILKSYPELIGYASDYGTLVSGFMSKMQSYSDLQIKAQMDEIMSGDAIFTSIKKEMKESLTKDEQAAFDDLKLNNLTDLQAYISNNSSELSKKLNNVVKSVLSKINLSSSVEYDTAKQFIADYSYFMDKQI